MVNFRTTQSRRPIIPYVRPDGRIVDVMWAVAVNDLVLKADEDGDRRGTSVHVARRYHARGYVLLVDLYAAEGKPEHYREYLGWANAVYYQEHSEAFPEALLPAEVLRRRADAAAGKKPTWKPTIPIPPEAAT